MHVNESVSVYINTCVNRDVGIQGVCKVPCAILNTYSLGAIHGIINP